MKKYAVLLTMLVFAGVQTGWADFLGIENVSFDGSLEVKAQQANNETDLSGPAVDHRGATATRLRVGMSAELADDIKGRVEAVRGPANTAGAVAQYGDGGSTIAGEEGAIQFQNAYLELNDFLRTDAFRIGRQYVGRPGDLLMYFGPIADDSLTVSALDALTLAKKWNKFTFSATTGKVTEDDAVGNADGDDAATAGDVNVSWITATTDELIPDMKIPLELGWYSGTDSNGPASGDNNNLTIIDLRAGYSLMDDMVQLGLEYAMNGGGLNGGASSPPAPAGSKLNYKGTALLLSARYDNDDEGWGVGLRYANTSGDDKGDADDESFHDFSTLGVASSDFRFGEIMSYDNTAATALGGINLGGLDSGVQGPGANVIALEGWYQLPWWDNKLKAMAGYYMAKMNEVGPGADDGIGSEIDLTVNYAHSETIGASLGYATFSPDKGLAQLVAPANPNPPQDDVTKITAKLWVKWGGERMY